MKRMLALVALVAVISMAPAAWAADTTYKVLGTEALRVSGAVPQQLTSSVSPVARKIWIASAGSDCRWWFDATIRANNGVLLVEGVPISFDANDPTYEFQALRFKVSGTTDDPLGTSGATIYVIYYD